MDSSEEMMVVGDEVIFFLGFFHSIHSINSIKFK